MISLQLIKENNFKLVFSRDIYVNIKLKKIFSLEFLLENTSENILKKINEKNNSEWMFYFLGGNPDEMVKKEILDEILI